MNRASRGELIEVLGSDELQTLYSFTHFFASNRLLDRGYHLCSVHLEGTSEGKMYRYTAWLTRPTNDTTSNVL